MLKVAVEHDHAFSLCFIEPGKNCCLLAKISGKADASYTGVIGSRFLDFLPGPVFRAIINKEHLKIDMRIVKDPGDRRRCGPDHLFLVIGGKYDGKHRSTLISQVIAKR